MEETEWPKRFDLLPVVRRNFIVFLLALSALMLLAGLFRSALVHSVLAAVTLACALFVSRAQAPVAEAWSDHVSILGPRGRKLVSVSYGQITRLEETQQTRLTVYYQSSGKQQKGYIPAAFIPGLDSLKELLRAKTGLEITIRQPWWSRLLRRQDPLIPWDERGAWIKALLLLVLSFVTYLSASTGVWVGWNWLTELGWVARWPVFGLSLAAGLGALVATVSLLHRGRYVLVAVIAVPLSLLTPSTMWLRFSVLPPLPLWVPAVAAAVALVVAAVASRILRWKPAPPPEAAD